MKQVMHTRHGIFVMLVNRFAKIIDEQDTNYHLNEK